MSKSNLRLIDTPDTVAIKPASQTSSKELEIEDLDMPLDEYLDSLGLGEKSVAKTRSDSTDTRWDSAIDRIEQKYGLRIKAND